MRNMRLFAVTLFLLPLFSFSQEEPLPVIDVHLHVETEIWLEKRLCFPQPCSSTETRDDILAVQDELTIQEMDKNNIVIGFLSEYNYDSVTAWDHRHPGRFYKGIIIGEPDKADLDLIESEIKKGNIKVLGEITSQYFNYPIDDPSLDPFFALANKYDVPVFVHVLGLGGDPNFPIDIGNPIRLAKVLSKYPHLRLWMENAGWPYLDETISLMYTYPNLYVDLSTITWVIPDVMFKKHLKGLMDAGLGKRIMFGSDQMLWPEVISLAIDAINKVDFLTKEQKQDIFYNNAARFFRLSEEEINQHHEMVK